MRSGTYRWRWADIVGMMGEMIGGIDKIERDMRRKSRGRWDVRAR